jgi:lipopolysaccharide exporter
MARIRIVNVKGDLFATSFCFLGQAAIKLGSSLIITRILRPEDYGVITVLLSMVFVIEMLADIGVTVFIIRDKNAEEPRYLNTAWTMRLGRAIINSIALFVLGPFIAIHIYNTSALVAPLRVFSLWFIIAGLQTMSFPIAVRRKNSKKLMYSELAATIVGTVFSVSYCYFSHDYWGMIYATLLTQLMMTVLSYQFFKELRPRLQFDWPAAKEILGFTKFTMPSSMLTLGLSQFDKIVFLRLFDLQLLGVYGLAANIAGPIESLISKISQTVLYPRCAHNYREDPSTFFTKYYTENVRLFCSIMMLPALVGGAAQLVISVFYPSRYSESALILEAFMLRAILLSLASPAEDLLIAAGEPQVLLVGNMLRATWMFSASLIGYHFYGFTGFTFGAASSGLPVLTYYLWLQSRKRLTIWKYETYKLVFIATAATAAYFLSNLFSTLWPNFRIRG